MTVPGLPAPITTGVELTKVENQAPAGAATASNRAPPALKAAILITALGPEAAGLILGGMNEANIRQFAIAISKIERIPPGLLEATIFEFFDELGDDATIRGGADKARAFIGEVLDDASVARIMEDVEIGGGASLWEELSASSDRALASFLQGEHPQTGAVILSEMRTDKAARILELLEPEHAQIIVLRLSRIPRVDLDVIELVQDVIARNFLSAMRREKSSRKPADLIGSLLNNISGSVRDKFIENLEAEKPTLAQEVMRVMFTFGDITSRLEVRDVTLLVRNVEEPVLMTALKAGEENYPNTVEFILGNLSKRLSERLVEDLAAMRDVKRRDGEIAQMEVVKAVQTLAQKGEIKLVEMDSSDD